MRTINEQSTTVPSAFSHHMRKEIYEQPAAISRTIARHLKGDTLFPDELLAIESALLTFDKLIIAASGSSRHAGLAGELGERLALAVRRESELLADFQRRAAVVDS